MEKMLLLAGVAGAAIYYFGANWSEQETTNFPFSKEQVTAMLTNARTVLPRRDGDGKIEIWSAGRSAQGVKLNMKYASWAPLLECQAVITPVTVEESRVVADCGAAADPKSAASRTQNQLRAPMFAEHIASTLGKRPFDRDRVDRMESATVFQNLGGMQAEAIQASQADQSKTAKSK